MGESVKTVNGFDFYVVLSALQKEIRRGKDVEALYWAMELIESNQQWMMFNRLRVTLFEDISVACPEKAGFILQAINQAEEWHSLCKKENKRLSWRLPLTTAIILMCNAKKNRSSDYLQVIVRAMRHFDYVPEIPDYVYDKHTRKGKSMGRGVDHFIKEGAYLDKFHYIYKNDVDNDLEEMATSFWKYQEKFNKDFDTVEPCQDGSGVWSFVEKKITEYWQWIGKFSRKIRGV